MFLLSGEYDYSCTPEQMLAVANSISGCQVAIMTYLLPVLQKIAANESMIRKSVKRFSEKIMLRQ